MTVLTQNLTLNILVFNQDANINIYFATIYYSFIVNIQAYSQQYILVFTLNHFKIIRTTFLSPVLESQSHGSIFKTISLPSFCPIGVQESHSCIPTLGAAVRVPCPQVPLVHSDAGRIEERTAKESVISRRLHSVDDDNHPVFPEHEDQLANLH